MKIFIGKYNLIRDTKNNPLWFDYNRELNRVTARAAKMVATKEGSKKIIQKRMLNAEATGWLELVEVVF
ncbi:MAG: hypothetical protein V4676_11130 [Bacteroidota bacterium]